MSVRDVREDDVDAIATLIDAPSRSVTSMLRDRTVRVVEDGSGDVSGVVAFDASLEAVEISTLAGDPSVYPELLAEPIRFGRSIDRHVEMVVPTEERETIDALRNAGFDVVGDGPAFHGEPTTTLRRDQ